MSWLLFWQIVIFWFLVVLGVGIIATVIRGEDKDEELDTWEFPSSEHQQYPRRDK